MTNIHKYKGKNAIKKVLKNINRKLTTMRELDEFFDYFNKLEKVYK
jgi:hypothetical protein